MASTQTLSPEFNSTYGEWRNSRLEALPGNRKVYRWHEAMVKENIWNRWFLAGIVESEIMLSRSALALLVAHIYDKVKERSIDDWIRKQRRARNDRIQLIQLIDFFHPPARSESDSQAAEFPSRFRRHQGLPCCSSSHFPRKLSRRRLSSLHSDRPARRTCSAHLFAAAFFFSQWAGNARCSFCNLRNKHVVFFDMGWIFLFIMG